MAKKHRKAQPATAPFEGIIWGKVFVDLTDGVEWVPCASLHITSEGAEAFELSKTLRGANRPARVAMFRLQELSAP